MRTFVCYEFSDGEKTVFFKGNPKNHIHIKLNELFFLNNLNYSRIEYKRLKIPYSKWLKHIEKRALSRARKL